MRIELFEVALKLLFNAVLSKLFNATTNSCSLNIVICRKTCLYDLGYPNQISTDTQPFSARQEAMRRENALYGTNAYYAFRSISVPNLVRDERGARFLVTIL